MSIPSLKVLSFYKNQADIIASHCVNKQKPELHCQGHCFLKKQLEEDSNKKENNTLPEIEIFIPLAYELNADLILHQQFKLKNKVFYAAFNDEVLTYNADIFTPPQLSIS